MIEVGGVESNDGKAKDELEESEDEIGDCERGGDGGGGGSRGGFEFEHVGGGMGM